MLPGAPGEPRGPDLRGDPAILRALSDASPAERARALEILRAFGAHATSFQILEAGFTYWFDDSVEAPGAVIAWVQAGRYRVAAGVPIAPAGRSAEVGYRFAREATEAGDKVLFFSADEEFVQALRQEPGVAFDSVVIGEQPEWDPREYRPRGKVFRSLRGQINRAHNKEVRIRTVAPEELTRAPGPLRAEIETVLARWKSARRMSAMRFMVDLQPFHHARERRFYVAEHDDRAVGFLAAIPVYQRDGWFFEDVIRAPEAPNGTVELLVHTALEHAREAGDQYVTLGLAPLAGVPAGDGAHAGLRRVLRWCYRHLGGLYQFDGLRRFKERFRPHVWQPQYLVQIPPGLGVRSFHAVLRAFAGGGLLAFGVDTARRWLARVPLRAWAVTLFVLAALLVPWTLLLAAADGRQWFGDASIQHAWVAFDAAMVGALAGLGWLVWRGRSAARALAIFLAGATLTDFVLTAVQAVNLHRDLAGWTQAFVFAGMAGPLLATAFLALLAAVAPLPERRD